MTDLKFIRYRKLKNGNWEAYDRNGNTAEGYSKDDARRKYYLYYEIPRTSINGCERKGLIPTEELVLDK